MTIPQTADPSPSPALPFRRVLLTSLSGQLGGMEMRLADEARFLAERGSQCLLAPSRFPGSDAWLEGLLAENPAFATSEVNPPPFFEQWRWRHLNFLRARALWPARLRRLDADLAHVFYAWTYDGGTRAWLCHAAGIPMVLSVHNSFPQSELSAFHRQRMTEAFSSIKGLYAVSASALDHFLTTYGSFVRDDTLATVVPNFVDVHRFTPNAAFRQELRATLGIPDGALVIGSVGRLDTQKEPFHVLAMFEQLAAERDDIFLVFCGHGPLEAEVARQAALSPARERIRFLGFRRDVERVFPALDVHVLLSKQEGFGISTAEAMACGVPVVVTDVPGTRDVLENSGAGHSVSYGAPADAAAALRHLLAADDQRRHMGEAGRRHATSQFAKEVWKEKLDDFYQRVAARMAIYKR